MCTFALGLGAALWARLRFVELASYKTLMWEFLKSSSRASSTESDL